MIPLALSCLMAGLAVAGGYCWGRSNAAFTERILRALVAGLEKSCDDLERENDDLARINAMLMDTAMDADVTRERDAMWDAVERHLAAERIIEETK